MCPVAQTLLVSLRLAEEAFASSTPQLSSLQIILARVLLVETRWKIIKPLCLSVVSTA